MVLIAKKIRKKRGDIVLITLKSINDMFERHVDRLFLAPGRPNTCFVSSKYSWTGKPSHTKIIRLLLESLEYRLLYEGEKPYPIPHHLFTNILCRDFDSSGNPISDPFEGDFMINLKRIRGGGKLAVKTLMTIDHINASEDIKIKNTINKIEAECEQVMIFFIHHIHPARKR
ncbi:MAG: hypothetical protein V1740_01915 [Candidatus Woesearchaeota archaeon]